MIYQKWRELIIDPFKIKFNNIIINKIISYLPAGNDVIECECKVNDKKRNCFIKIERSKAADFDAELNNLDIIKQNDYYDKVPNVLDRVIYDGRKIIVLEKIEGVRLSDIFNRIISDDERRFYLKKYGMELALIHQIPCNNFNLAKQRSINDYPKGYQNIDNYIEKYINLLKKSVPLISYNTFIHGDFHYANILWKNKQINGVIDFEYSGKGFKEQDIAWSCVLRPTQTFMDNVEDVLSFVCGYKQIGSFDQDKFRWCLLNAYCHFYLMNINNKEYIKKLKFLICEIEKLNHF